MEGKSRLFFFSLTCSIFKNVAAARCSIFPMPGALVH